MVNEEGGGERARGAARRFEADEEDEEEELGREKSDSESEGEELARFETEGGEMVGLDGVQPTGERERELVEEEVDDLRREKLVKASMLIIELSRLDVSVVCRLGLCRSLEV